MRCVYQRHRHFPSAPLLRFMKSIFVFFLPLLASIAPAQIPIVPALTVEQTRVPVFTDFKAAAPEQTLEHAEALANFRLHLEYQVPAGGGLSLRLNPQRTLELKPGAAAKWQTLDLQYEQLRGKPASFSATVNGKALAEGELIPGTAAAVVDQDRLHLGGDFTAMVRFTAKGDGALFARCRTEKWEPDAKMLGLRGGRLFYDIGWLGVVSGMAKNLTDGQPHTAVVRSHNGRVTLFVDGKADGARDKHSRPDAKGHAFHIGQGAKGFVGDLQDGEVENLRYWERALSDAEAQRRRSSATQRWQGGCGEHTHRQLDAARRARDLCERHPRRADEDRAHGARWCPDS